MGGGCLRPTQRQWWVWHPICPKIAHLPPHNWPQERTPQPTGYPHPHPNHNPPDKIGIHPIYPDRYTKLNPNTSLQFWLPSYSASNIYSHSLPRPPNTSLHHHCHQPLQLYRTPIPWSSQISIYGIDTTPYDQIITCNSPHGLSRRPNHESPTSQKWPQPPPTSTDPSNSASYFRHPSRMVKVDIPSWIFIREEGLWNVELPLTEIPPNGRSCNLQVLDGPFEDQSWGTGGMGGLPRLLPWACLPPQYEFNLFPHHHDFYLWYRPSPIQVPCREIPTWKNAVLIAELFELESLGDSINTRHTALNLGGDKRPSANQTHIWEETTPDHPR